MTLRDLLDTLEGKDAQRPARRQDAGRDQSPAEAAQGPGRRSKTHSSVDADQSPYATILGLPGATASEIVINPDRPFIPDLNDLPMPRHELLPLDKQSMPMIKGPFTFIVTSRGCPAGCKYCIKHVTYQNSVRVRSAENIVEELEYLDEPGHPATSTCTPISSRSTASM